MIIGQLANLARMPRSFYYFLKGFLMTTESQDLGLMFHAKDGAFDSIVSPSLY